jgi:membrane-bound lytic murein transglycosylase D
LKQNWWYDGRRDVVASTHAAFDYLESLVKRFDGNWEHALAAYNCGGGCVNRAIRENKAKDKPTDFWSLSLPKETRIYVPKLLAICSAIKNPTEAGIELREIPNKPYFASVDIGSQLDMALAADMAGITTDELYRLNSGMNRWATAPDGPHRLNLPIAKTEEFKQKLSELEPNQRIHWKRYKIQSGDTVSTIAEKFGTTSALIREANNLDGNNIRAGKHLVIPTATKSLEHYALTADKRQKGIQNRERKGNKLIHIVKSGDNFWDLAREYNVNHRKLARWNGMAPKDTLKLNQKLVLWVDNKTLKKHDNKLAAIMDVHPPGTRNTIYYRVREGDSLSTIAHRFKVKVSNLKKWNSLSSKLLKPGQNLKLFVDASSQSH